ncbi:unnamed protein product, partial [Polarella glacialis]
DNTYKTVPLKSESCVEDVTQWLCKRVSASGRRAEPDRHELLIIAPGNQSLRERLLLREDKPLQIQLKGGASAFKFLFREVRSSEPSAGGDTNSGDEAAFALPGTLANASQVPVVDASGRLRAGQLELLLADGVTWHSCTVILDADRLWYSQVPNSQDGSIGGGMSCWDLTDCGGVVRAEGDED